MNKKYKKRRILWVIVQRTPSGILLDYDIYETCESARRAARWRNELRGGNTYKVLKYVYCAH